VRTFLVLSTNVELTSAHRGIRSGTNKMSVKH
jgi:hypothetical protein